LKSQILLSYYRQHKKFKNMCEDILNFWLKRAGAPFILGIRGHGLLFSTSL
jgi:hypothetical protein